MGAAADRLYARRKVTNAVAVLLCRTAVTPMPAIKAWKRFFRTFPKKRLMLAPKARTMPLCTMWSPQSRRATPPTRSNKIFIPMVTFSELTISREEAF